MSVSVNLNLVGGLQLRLLLRLVLVRERLTALVRNRAAAVRVARVDVDRLGARGLAVVPVGVVLVGGEIRLVRRERGPRAAWIS